MTNDDEHGPAPTGSQASTDSGAPVDPFWTTEEVAQRLGLEAHHIRAAIRAGRLRAYKFGATRLGYRIPESAVQEWLAASEVHAEKPDS